MLRNDQNIILDLNTTELYGSLAHDLDFITWDFSVIISVCNSPGQILTGVRFFAIFGKVHITYTLSKKLTYC